ncbi:50S ribosomal protein L25 [bacterium]|nr:50S ribosomal protein L25 [bacterium]
MKEAKLFGVKREDLGKGASGRMRKEGVIPCIITRKEGNINFSSFINDFNPIVFTPDTYLVNIEVDGSVYKTIIKEVQFNPLSDEVQHVDFLEVSEEQPVTCELPIEVTGVSPGVLAGGKLVTKIRKLKVKGNLSQLPERIPVNISGLSLGKSVRVKNVAVDGIEILNSPNLPIATVEIPRALKSQKAQ